MFLETGAGGMLARGLWHSASLGSAQGCASQGTGVLCVGFELTVQGQGLSLGQGMVGGC